MILHDIQRELDAIQHEIFAHTLTPKSDSEILRLLNQVRYLQHRFLRFPLTSAEVSLPEIEDLRFELIEAEETLDEFMAHPVQGSGKGIQPHHITQRATR